MHFTLGFGRVTPSSHGWGAVVIHAQAAPSVSATRGNGARLANVKLRIYGNRPSVSAKRVPYTCAAVTPPPSTFPPPLRPCAYSRQPGLQEHVTHHRGSSFSQAAFTCVLLGRFLLKFPNLSAWGPQD